MKKTPKKVTLQTLDKKIDGITNTVGALTGTVGELKGTVGALTGTVGELKGTVGALTGTVGELTDTVDSLARSTKEGFDRMDSFHTDMTEFAKKNSLTLFNIDSKLQTVDQRLDTMEKSLPSLGTLSDALKREVLQLNIRVGKIETRVGIK